MKRIALVGMPNTGKSTFFNRVTGASARVGNWPGVTVDLYAARVPLGGAMAELVDLPGIYDLDGTADDERVVRSFLANTRVDLIAIIVAAPQIDRQLSLVLRLRALGVPVVLLLNMADEARRLGIRIDAEALERELGIRVALMAAKRGDGHADALRVLARGLVGRGDAAPAAAGSAPTAVPDEREESRILAAAVDIPARLPAGVTDRLDRVLLGPLIGLPLFFLTMFVVFQGVFTLGKPLQDGLSVAFDVVRQYALEPAFAPLPALARGFLLDGIWAGVTTVAAFVPLVVLFFLFMALVEDTGYLSRAAFLTDALMARLGLDGRSFVMLLLGFGCNVPAAMGTRIMRSRSLRLLTMLIVPFSLCSARLQVFVFLAAALFAPALGAWVLFALYLVSFAMAMLTAVVFRHRFRSDEPFVLELPPYRLPTLRQIVLRAWHEVRHFLHRATRFIVVGVVLVWLLTHLPTGAAPGGPDTLAGMLGRLAEPMLAPIGIDAQLTVALIFGFVAKEILIGAFAVIFGMEGQALASELATHVDAVQAISFMLFTLIYTPCLSMIATLRSESRSTRFATLSVAWSLALAWVVSFAFYQSARALGF
jgi:ferrous iron transport protein B